MDVEFDLLQVCTRTHINLLWVRSHRLQHLRSSQAKKLWPHRTERIIYIYIYIYIIIDILYYTRPQSVQHLLLLKMRTASFGSSRGGFPQLTWPQPWRMERKAWPSLHMDRTRVCQGWSTSTKELLYLYHRYPWATSNHMLGRRHDFSGTSDLARPWAIPERAPKLSERAPRQHFKSQHLRCGPKWVYEIEWRPWSQKSSFCSFLLDLAGLYFGIHQKEGGKWRPWCDHDHGHAGRHLCGSWPRAPGWAYIQQSHRFDEELAAKGPGQLHPSFPETMQHVSSPPIQLKRQQDKP